MFDRNAAPRPPTAWRADPTLFTGASAADFAAWRIPALQGELSPLSREALARFETEQSALDEADPPPSEPEVVLAPFKPTLPHIVTQFVPDVHVPVGQTLREPAVEALPTDAEATAPMQSAEQPIDGDGSSAWPDADPVEGAADAGLEAVDGAVPPSAQPAADEAQSPVEDDSLPDATEADLVADDVLAADALAQAEQERAESLAAQAQAVGVDPDEVARREAEQYQLGREEGERAAREAMEQEVRAQCTVLAGVAQDLHALLQSPTEFFEPLKRLAMHLAEQITLTQWQSSTQTLEALIRRCLDALDPGTQGAVVVELHPLDKARLQQAAPELIRGMRLDANETLRVGSVRLYANDTVVEDLIEHRLPAIVRSLDLDVQAWEQRSLLLREPTPPAQTVTDTDIPPAAEDDDAHS